MMWVPVYISYYMWSDNIHAIKHFNGFTCLSLVFFIAQLYQTLALVKQSVYYIEKS